MAKYPAIICKYSDGEKRRDEREGGGHRKSSVENTRRYRMCASDAISRSRADRIYYISEWRPTAI